MKNGFEISEIKVNDFTNKTLLTLLLLILSGCAIRDRVQHAFVPPSGIAFEGKCSYVSNNIEGERILQMSVEKIKNLRGDGGLSGTLRISVWATKVPYDGDSLSGHVLGSVKLGQLQAGYALENVKKNSKYAPPSKGSYFMSMVLQEYDGGKFYIVDVCEFDKKSYF